MSILSALSSNPTTIFNASTDVSTKWKQNFAKLDDSDETDSEISHTANHLNVLSVSPTKKGAKYNINY